MGWVSHRPTAREGPCDVTCNLHPTCIIVDHMKTRAIPNEGDLIIIHDRGETRSRIWVYYPPIGRWSPHLSIGRWVDCGTIGIAIDYDGEYGQWDVLLATAGRVWVAKRFVKKLT